MNNIILSTEEGQYNVKVSVTINIIVVESVKPFNKLSNSTKLLFVGKETWAINGKHYNFNKSTIYFFTNEIELKKLSI